MMKELMERSGNVVIKSRLVSFLYDLMRDHLPVGEVEKLISDSTDDEVSYTNGYLAKYALEVAQRLQRASFQGDLAKDVLLTRFQMVKAGVVTPEEATEKVYAAIISSKPVISTRSEGEKEEPKVTSSSEPLGTFGIFYEPRGHMRIRGGWAVPDKT